MDQDARAFLDQLEDSVGPPPEFATGKDPMDQFYTWIKWSGKKQLYEAMRQKIAPQETEL